MWSAVLGRKREHCQLRLFPSINLEVKDDSIGNGNDRDTYREGMREEACQLVQELEVAEAEPAKNETELEDASAGGTNDHPTVELGRREAGRRIRYPSTRMKNFVP